MRCSSVGEPASIDSNAWSAFVHFRQALAQGEGAKNPGLNAMEMKRIRMECNQCSLLLFSAVSILFFLIFCPLPRLESSPCRRALILPTLLLWNERASRAELTGTRQLLAISAKLEKETEELDVCHSAWHYSWRLLLIKAKGSSFSDSFPFLYYIRRFCPFVFRLSDEEAPSVTFRRAAIISPALPQLANSM